MAIDLARQDDTQRAVAVADHEEAAGALAHILATGDLAKLSNGQRVAYYLDLCASLSLNPRSRPFDWLLLDGKLVFYPNKSCAEQLRREHQISVKITRREIVGDMFVVEVEGRTPNGRTDESTKYVPLTGPRGRLVGKDLANAFAKAETGAKRRLVLSMVGLASPPDPEEVKGARFVVVDGTGQILDHPTEEQRYLAEHPNAARAIGEPTYESTGGADRAPLAGSSGQQVRPDELEWPRREGPPASFRPSDEDVRRWLGAWFAIVDDTPWDPKEARARFVADYTRDFPDGLRTSSLRDFLGHATERQAGDFLARIRAVVAVWREGQQAEERGEPELGSDVGLTPEAAAEEIVGQERGEEPSHYDEELDARLEAATEKSLGRRPVTGKTTAQTRTALVAELRRLVKAVQEQGGSVDAPANLADLTDEEVREMSRGLREALDTVAASAAPTDGEPAF